MAKNKSGNWTPEIDALLGKLPDKEVAELAGVKAVTVLHRRRARGIPPLNSPKIRAQWTPEILAMLGKMLDIEIADRLGVSVNAVAQKRWKLGIPACEPKRNDPGVPAKDMQALVELLNTYLSSQEFPETISSMARDLGFARGNLADYLNGTRLPDRARYVAMRSWLRQKLSGRRAKEKTMAHRKADHGSTIHRAVAQVRRDLDMSPDFVAESGGIPAQDYIDFEEGTREIDTGALKKIMTLLGMGMSVQLGGAWEMAIDWDALKRDYAAGYSTRRLGEKYEISYAAVQNHLKKRGIPIRSNSQQRVISDQLAKAALHQSIQKTKEHP